MEPTRSEATAVAVSGTRICGVGPIEELRVLGDYARVDDTFADAVICPGLIDQHLPPVLRATTLVTEVIATEDWAFRADGSLPRPFLTQAVPQLRGR